MTKMKKSSTIETPIKFKVFIKTTQENAFNSLATDDGLDKWFTRGSSINRHKPGGTLTLKWINWGVDNITGTIHCPIIEYSFPEIFTFKWWDDHYTTVKFTFKKVEDGTIVAVNEIGYEYSKEGIKRCIECSVGWGEALTLLKIYLEHGISYN